MLKAAVLLVFVLLRINGSLSNHSRRIEFNFQQSDYKLDFQRSELVRYNKQMIKYYDLHTFKYNRTSAAMNITNIYNIDLGNDLEIIMQAYKFMSNEYRYFPIRFQVNYCSAVAQNFFGMGRFGACGNFTHCPILKNTRYHCCNFAPEQSQFPPLIPDGEYMLELQGIYRSTELFVMRSYGKVYRPILMP